jgi:hypothetical protein
MRIDNSNNKLNLNLEIDSENMSHSDVLLQTINTALYNYKEHHNKLVKNRNINFVLHLDSNRLDPEKNNGLVANAIYRLEYVIKSDLTDYVDSKTVWTYGVGFTHMSQVLGKDWAVNPLIDFLKEMVGCMHIMVDANIRKSSEEIKFTKYVKTTLNSKNIKTANGE